VSREHEVCRAELRDVPGIVAAMRANADERSLAQQSEAYLCGYIAGFLVVRDGRGGVLGSAQVREYLPGYVEILAVSIHPRAQGLGVGGALMRAAVDAALVLQPRVLWLSTEKPAYFEKFGFSRFSQWELPLRILVRKALVVFRQRPGRWWPQLTGAPVFMKWQRAAHRDD